jgi:hypothetical protein
MVDIAYLGFDGSTDLTSLSIGDVERLLDARYIPFDGLNSAGLAVGMAAVPPGKVPDDPKKETVGSLGAIRVMLDKAATVGEALDLLLSYNIDFEGGPPVNYLIADALGESLLVEYYERDVHTIPSQTSWHQATNFLVAAVDSTSDQCHRYDAISAVLEARAGNLDLEAALSLLRDVAQATTQWSVVYDVQSGNIRVAMGRDFSRIREFELDMAD